MLSSSPTRTRTKPPRLPLFHDAVNRLNRLETFRWASFLITEPGLRGYSAAAPAELSLRHNITFASLRSSATCTGARLPRLPLANRAINRGCRTEMIEVGRSMRASYILTDFAFNGFLAPAPTELGMRQNISLANLRSSATRSRARMPCLPLAHCAINRGGNGVLIRRTILFTEPGFRRRLAVASSRRRTRQNHSFACLRSLAARI